MGNGKRLRTNGDKRLTPFKQRVAGSTPARPTKYFKGLHSNECRPFPRFATLLLPCGGLVSSRSRCLLPVCYPAATLAGQSASASRFVFVLLAGDLTPARIPGNLTFPKHYKACRSLRQRPTLERIAAFLVSATEAPRAFRPWDAVTYWRNNVLMFVRLRRPCSGRGALFRLFLFPIPKF